MLWMVFCDFFKTIQRMFYFPITLKQTNKTFSISNAKVTQAFSKSNLYIYLAPTMSACLVKHSGDSSKNTKEFCN